MVTRAFLILLLLSCNACVRGYLYTNTVLPYCTDMVKTGGVATDIRPPRRIRSVSVPRVPGLRAAWSNNSLAEAARTQGIETVEFCDRRKFSILGGLYGEDGIIIYGR